jgi:hypothetical protein
MKAREIKDLSIALEALSRINGYKFEGLSDRIQDLLSDLIKEEETKVEPAPKPSTTEDDEIPF